MTDDRASNPVELDLPAAIEMVRPSVVQIGVRLDPRKLPETLGTGFIVDERGTVITALHVINAGAKRVRQAGLSGPPVIVAGLAHPQWFEAGGHTYGMQGFSYVDLTILAVGERFDLAAGRLVDNVLAGEWDEGLVPVVDGVPVPPITGVASLDGRRPRDGESVGVSGYPFAMNSLITNSGCIATAFLPSFADDAVPDPPVLDDDAPGGTRQVEIAVPGEQATERYLADLEVNPGNSGGPVYRVDSGEVIGVCVATRSALVTGMPSGGVARIGSDVLVYSSGLTVIIPAQYVLSMLRHELVQATA